MRDHFFTRERFFIGYSPESADAEPVFAADDLSEIECQTLVAAVQRLFDDIHRSSGGGPWTLELGPSAQDDPVAFIDCKAKWQAHQRSFDEYRAAHGGHWRSEIVWLHDICAERADVIRALREHAIPTVYLQRDCGGGFQTFGKVDSLTWDELETLEAVLKNELYDMGMIFRLVSDLDAEESPEEFVQAKLGWNAIARELKVNEDAERDDAWWVAAEVIDELLSMAEVRAEVYERNGDSPTPPRVLSSTPGRDGRRVAHGLARTVQPRRTLGNRRQRIAIVYLLNAAAMA